MKQYWSFSLMGIITWSGNWVGLTIIAILNYREYILWGDELSWLPTSSLYLPTIHQIDTQHWCSKDLYKMKIWYLTSKHYQGHLCSHGMVSRSLCTLEASFSTTPTMGWWLHSAISGPPSTPRASLLSSFSHVQLFVTLWSVAFQ